LLFGEPQIANTIRLDRLTTHEVCTLKIWSRWLCILLFGLSACAAPLPAPSAVPSPQPLRVRTDTAFEPLLPLLAGCVPPGLALYFVRPDQPADLTLSWDVPRGPSPDVNQDPPVPAYILGSEDLVLVVHPSNAIPSLKSAVVQVIYAGHFTNWDPVGGQNLPLTAWTYPAGEAIQRIFEASILQPEVLSAQIHTAPGPRELRAAVAADPGGLGFLPRRWLDGSVRELSIPDADPAAFTRPLLASMTIQPAGEIKDFLLCLQEGLKTP